MDLFEFPAGEVIFNAGDPANHAFLILEGKVEMLKGRSETAARLAMCGSGDVIGEMSLIGDRPHSLTAKAVSPVKLTAVTRVEFDRMLTTDPANMRPYLNALFERLRTLSSQVVDEIESPLRKSPMVSVTIHPLTRQAATTLPRDGLPVTRYPFRIGRAAGNNEDIPMEMNDLWLVDEAPYNISRKHASIEVEADAVIVKDRGSSLGIFVNETHVGGKSTQSKMILDEGNNTLVLGKRMSPYQFRIDVARA